MAIMSVSLCCLIQFNLFYLLFQALLEKNPSISQSFNGNSAKKHSKDSKNSDAETEEEWSHISQIHRRTASFRDKSIDKWQRKTWVITGAAAMKSKLQAFNQEANPDGHPELLDDYEFYQQLLKKYFETIAPSSSGVIMSMRR
ncbi:uncharacterized protein LOC8265804 isoform X3 [Ricinus communis]|uniref:uncharacterized protein LOC8265804 isoform X3 n=1 Tax=Ricinus communis TaxID=3988 RepID=UPI00201A9E78|nr:uncharacterized protein LOC8265804 isoform X3 [Ricinus communis]